jgi:hypothetical protein
MISPATTAFSESVSIGEVDEDRQHHRVRI